MTQAEFKINANKLFKGYKIYRVWSNNYPNDYELTSDISLNFRFEKEFTLIKKRYDIFNDDIIYKSPRYSTYEEFFDELIIFKELILPKYL